MAVPKGFRSDINISPKRVGPERRQEILDNIEDKGSFLPKGVSEEDMDETFVDFITNTLSLTIDGAKIPVIFLTIQRWSEFSKTWQFTDKYKDVQLPFITIVRKPDIQVGQNQAGLYNIPGNRTYTYMKVPTWDGNRKGIDLYKIPQPTSVDITYEVRIFTNRLRDLNKFNSIVQRSFQSRQSYISVKGHPMPVHLENISDESNIEDFENKRFYVQLFEMKLLGYILDEDDFEIMPTVNRVYTFIEVDENLTHKNVIMEPVINNNAVTYTFIFKPSSEQGFTFTSKYDINFTRLENVDSITRIVILINGLGVFDGLVMNTPIRVHANDLVTIRIYKRNLDTGKFELIGNTL
jgi:hypothetical protein